MRQILLLVLIVPQFYLFAKNNGQLDLNWSSHIDKVFHIKLLYPSTWTKVPGYEVGPKFAGDRGFFHYSAVGFGSPVPPNTDISLKGRCEDEAGHKLKPYGSNPKIKYLTQSGVKSCFVFPSADQEEIIDKSAAFIIPYPKSVTINNETYSYFVLWADKHHIERIARSIQFVFED